MNELDALLGRMKAIHASDLHLKSGAAPRYRVRGHLEALEGYREFPAADLDRLRREILSPEQLRLLEERREIDFGYGDIARGRFRANYFDDHNGPAAAFRSIPGVIPSLKELNLPETLESFVHARGGLVMVTGATGSGKTTTLAALVDIINANYRKHVITLEDPIEYLHESKMCLVQQRGLHYDIRDFPSGIADALKEDPDVLLIGEMRDLETIRLALSAAELGVLVFSTLHTNGAGESCDRIIDVFPDEEQPQIRAMLSQSLAGVVSQALLRRADGTGRLPAVEVLVATPAVRSLIRENKIHEMASLLQMGRAQGMQLLDDSLHDLVSRKLVDPEEAYAYARGKSRFEQFLA